MAVWVAVCCTSCSRAPSFDIVGSFFPAWMLCFGLGLLLTAAAHWLLSRAHVVLAIPIVTYPSLAALLSFTLWLAFFQ